MKRILLAIILTIGLIAPVWADAQADGLQDARAAMKAGDFGKALGLLMPLAKDGNTGAQNAVGVHYEKGWGVPQNHRMAVDWYRKSAEQGNAKGQMNLGRMYHLGHGVQRDYAEAVKWYRKSAEQGHTKGMGSLAIMYEDGFGVDQNYGEAIKWYRKAAEQGDSLAQGNLGAMLALGKGVQRDYAKAIKLYRKAAEQGNTISMFSLGYMHEVGQGMAANPGEALKWYGMAAQRGHPRAKEKLKALGGLRNQPLLFTQLQAETITLPGTAIAVATKIMLRCLDRGYNAKSSQSNQDYLLKCGDATEFTVVKKGDSVTVTGHGPNVQEIFAWLK